MKKGKRQFRKCKWCDSPVKEGYSKHRFKQYYKTCGKRECTTAALRDFNVRMSKRFNKERICQFCKEKYMATSPLQRWCKKCSPNKRSAKMLRVYGINKIQWDDMFKKQGGICKLCPKPAMAVDHDHKTNRIRGLLCYKCNMLVGVLEKDPAGMVLWIKKALKYIK